MRRVSASLLMAMAIVACAGPFVGTARAAEVTVFAAASLKNALDDVVHAWHEASGNRAVVAYAGSSQLARQIEQGAPADLFISANPDWMDHLERAKLIDPASRKDLLGNRLVLVAHGRDAAPVAIGPGFDLAGLLGRGRLAMAMVDSVPAGMYGKAALESLGVWPSVRDHVAQADNVRAALTLVALGEAPYGIVYATDAAAADDVTVVGTFPEASHPPIVYPVALTLAGDTPEARQLLAFIASPAARPLFERQGFTVLD